MAAAYAALVSVSNLIDQIKLSFHVGEGESFSLIVSLQEKVRFLRTFLERYYGDDEEAEDLGRKIADSAYEAEDIIDSHVIGDIRVSRTKKVHKGRLVHFSRALQKVIEKVESIEKRVVIMIEKSVSDDDQQPRDIASGTGSSLRPSSEKEITMVGFNDVLGELVEKLTHRRPDLQRIAITGMGGIGKTTLARAGYASPLIVRHFDVRSWTAISQEYKIKEILLRILHDITGHDFQEELKKDSYKHVGEKVWKHLWMRRYLIILDDAWDIESFEKLMTFFPDNRNGSRIVLTTRLSTVADNFESSSSPCKLDLLSENLSWSLLCVKVFNKGSCPPELEEIGKRIAKNCKGLPLSISVVGGLLAKSKLTQEYWNNIANDISAIVNSEDDELFLKIVSLSYRNLPIHLKPCFLYMCVFPEDHEIRFSEIIRLWIAEGFLKPSNTKRSEEVAEDYLKELINRNLLSSFATKWWGPDNHFNIHDLLRDFCLREAEKENFCYVNNFRKPKVSTGMINPHRVITQGSYSDLNSAHSVRSLTFNGEWNNLQWRKHKLLRVLKALEGYSPNDELEGYSPNDVCKLFNLRYFHVTTECSYRFPSKMLRLWNLQTLIVRIKYSSVVVAPYEIWEMPRLRHIIIKPLVILPELQGDRFHSGKDEIVSHNLQTLKVVQNFRCTEKVIRKIPNIMKLSIDYSKDLRKEFSCYHLGNLGRLHTLQSLQCTFSDTTRPTRTVLLRNLEFPMSLKKLSLTYCNLDWEDIAVKIGPLPHLEELDLISSFLGEEWNPVEGQFIGLRSLSVDDCHLVYWRVDSTHFPQLEFLGLFYMTHLKIPSEIGEIPTLKTIVVNKCSDIVVRSAKKILKEQCKFGNEEIELVVDKITCSDYDYDDDDNDSDDNDDVDEEEDTYDDVDGEEDDEAYDEASGEEKEEVADHENYNVEQVVQKKKKKKNSKPKTIMDWMKLNTFRGRGARESLELLPTH